MSSSQNYIFPYFLPDLKSLLVFPGKSVGNQQQFGHRVDISGNNIPIKILRIETSKDLLFSTDQEIVSEI